MDPYSFQPEVEPRPNFAGWPFGVVFGPLHALLGTVAAWNAFVLLGYLGAGGLTFLWLRSLGLGRIGQTNEIKDSPELQGKLRKVAHLVRVESN